MTVTLFGTEIIYCYLFFAGHDILVMIYANRCVLILYSCISDKPDGSHIWLAILHPGNVPVKCHGALRAHVHNGSISPGQSHQRRRTAGYPVLWVCRE